MLRSKGENRKVIKFLRDLEDIWRKLRMKNRSMEYLFCLKIFY